MHLTTKNPTTGGLTLARVLTLAFVSLGLALTLGAPRQAEAFPPFAKKEKKPCSYCHVNAKGGGKRTAAGEWYHKHKSFKGFKADTKPKAPAKPKTGKPG